MAHISKYYSNSGKKNILLKSLIEPGIFQSRAGRIVTMNNDTIDRNIRKANGLNLVLGHNDPKKDNGIIIGKIVDVFCNGDDGALKPSGDLYTRKGWTCAYEIDEDALINCGLTLEEVKTLDLSISFFPKWSKQSSIYNNIKVQDEIIDFEVNNIALVNKGRYSCTQDIIDCSVEEDMVMVFSDATLDYNTNTPQDNSKDNMADDFNKDKEEDKKENSSEEVKSDEKKEDKQSEKPEGEKKDFPKDAKPEEGDAPKGLFGGDNQPNQSESGKGTITLDADTVLTLGKLKALLDSNVGLLEALNNCGQKAEPQAAPMGNIPDSNQATGIAPHEHNANGELQTPGVENHTHDANGNASDNVAEHSHEGGDTNLKQNNIPEADKKEDNSCINPPMNNGFDNQGGQFNNSNNQFGDKFDQNVQEQTILQKNMPKILSFLKSRLSEQDLQTYVEMMTPTKIQAADFLQNCSADQQAVIEDNLQKEFSDFFFKHFDLKKEILDKNVDIQSAPAGCLDIRKSLISSLL